MMAGFRAALGLALGMTAAAAVLAACDNGPSAVHSKTAAQSAAPAYGGSGGRSAYASHDHAAEPGVDHRKDEVKRVDGKPMWSPSKRFSAEGNAEHAFERNGEAFGARSIDQYVKKAHAFVDHQPADTLTLTRANGDTLFYDPRATVFAVANKDGAPRTMFKPDEGRAYWDKRKERASRQASGSDHRRRSSDDEA